MVRESADETINLHREIFAKIIFRACFPSKWTRKIYFTKSQKQVFQTFKESNSGEYLIYPNGCLSWSWWIACHLRPSCGRGQFWRLCCHRWYAGQRSKSLELSLKKSKELGKIPFTVTLLEKEVKGLSSAKAATVKIHLPTMVSDFPVIRIHKLS